MPEYNKGTHGQQKDRPVKCEKCNRILGFLDSEVSNCFRIKCRDLYLKILGSELIILNCRGCGEHITLKFSEIGNIDGKEK